MRHQSSVAILGGGLIGSAGALALDRVGREVMVVTRAPAPVERGRIGWIYGDADSAPALHAAQTCGALVLAGGSIGPATQVDTVHAAVADEILPVLRLAEAAGKAGARTIVFISSGGTVYGPSASLPTSEASRTAPINLYGMIKVMTEQALFEVGRRLGMAIIVLRVSNPYGPGQIGTRRLGFVGASIQAAITRQPLTIWGDGGATRDFVYIDDVGRAIALAADYTGDSTIVNIGSGREHRLLDVCELIGGFANRPLDLRFEPSRDCDVRRSALDISLAGQVLGWHPETMLETGVATTMRHVF